MILKPVKMNSWMNEPDCTWSIMSVPESLALDVRTMAQRKIAKFAGQQNNLIGARQMGMIALRHSANGSWPLLTTNFKRWFLPTTLPDSTLILCSIIWWPQAGGQSPAWLAWKSMNSASKMGQSTANCFFATHICSCLSHWPPFQQHSGLMCNQKSIFPICSIAPRTTPSICPICPRRRIIVQVGWVGANATTMASVEAMEMAMNNMKK